MSKSARRKAIRAAHSIVCAAKGELFDAEHCKKVLDKVENFERSVKRGQKLDKNVLHPIQGGQFESNRRKH